MDESHGCGITLPRSREIGFSGGTVATFNRIWFVGPWIGLVSDLGGLRNGQGHHAIWCGMGISFHGCLVVGRRCCKRRQRQRQLILFANLYSSIRPSLTGRIFRNSIHLAPFSTAQGKPSVLARAYRSALGQRRLLSL